MDGGLGGAISGGRSHRDKSQPGGDVHDGGVGLLLQQRQQRRGKTNRAQQIGGDGGFRVGQIGLLGLQLFDAHNARVVDEDVQRREVRRQISRKNADFGGVFDVERKGRS